MTLSYFILILWMLSKETTAQSNPWNLDLLLPHDTDFLRYGYTYINISNVQKILSLSNCLIKDTNDNKEYSGCQNVYLNLGINQLDTDQLGIKLNYAGDKLIKFTVSVDLKVNVSTSTNSSIITKKLNIVGRSVSEYTLADDFITITGKRTKTSSIDLKGAKTELKNLVGGVEVEHFIIYQSSDLLQFMFMFVNTDVKKNRIDYITALQSKNQTDIINKLCETLYINKATFQVMPFQNCTNNCSNPFCANRITYRKSNTFMQENVVTLSDGSLLMGPDVSWQGVTICEKSDDRLLTKCHPGYCLNKGKCVQRGPQIYCECPKLDNLESGPRCQLSTRSFNETVKSATYDLHSVRTLDSKLYFEMEYANIGKEFFVSIEQNQLFKIDDDNFFLYAVKKNELKKGGAFRDWRKVMLVIQESQIDVTICSSEDLDDSNSERCFHKTYDLSFDKVFIKQPQHLNISTKQVDGCCIKNVLINGEMIDLKDNYNDYTNYEGCQYQRRICGPSCYKNFTQKSTICLGHITVFSGGATRNFCECQCPSGTKKIYPSTENVNTCMLSDTTDKQWDCYKDPLVINRGSTSSDSDTWNSGSSGYYLSSKSADHRLSTLQFQLQTFQEATAIFELRMKTSSNLLVKLELLQGRLVERSKCENSSVYFPNSDKINDGNRHNVMLNIYFLHEPNESSDQVKGAISLIVDSKMYMTCDINSFNLEIITPLLKAVSSCVSSISLFGVELPSGTYGDNKLKTTNWTFSSGTTPTAGTTEIVPQFANGVSSKSTCEMVTPCTKCDSNSVPVFGSSCCKSIAAGSNLTCANVFPFVTCPSNSICSIQNSQPVCKCKNTTCASSFCDVCSAIPPPVRVAGGFSWWYILIIIIIIIVLIVIALLAYFCTRKEKKKEVQIVEKEILEIHFNEEENDEDVGCPPEDVKGKVNFVFPRILATSETDNENLVYSEPIIQSANLPLRIGKSSDDTDLAIDYTLTYETEDTNVDDIINVDLFDPDDDNDINFDFLADWGPQFQNLSELLR